MTAEEALGIKKSATEETLQSIDSTLKRIEFILRLKQNQSSVLDVPSLSEQTIGENSVD